MVDSNHNYHGFFWGPFDYRTGLGRCTIYLHTVLGIHEKRHYTRLFGILS